jgi:hypothetical protein
MTMYGPEIIARTMSIPTRRGKKSRKRWQYHGRSDAHSKIACWALLFDLLHSCDEFKGQARRGKVRFAVNHLMVGPINKTLDLVVCASADSDATLPRRSFLDLGREYGVQLSPAETALANEVPQFAEEHNDDLSEVLVALEAKACFTDLQGSIPRLHAEILATGYLARESTPSCITASYTLVNGSPRFTSPGKKGTIKHSRQPLETLVVLEMIRKAIPRAKSYPHFGYDAIGATVVDCANDGSPVTVLTSTPAPNTNDFIHYDRMIKSLCSAFRHRYRGR